MALFETLVDAFDTQNTSLWTFPSGTSVSGGELNIPASGSYPTVTSAVNYDLTNSYFYCALTATLNAAEQNQTYWDLISSTGNSIGWLIEGSARTLKPNYSKGGAATYFGTTPYSATTHKYLRIRHSGSSVFWDCSADALTWTQLGTQTTSTLGSGIVLTSMQVGLGAGFWGGSGGGIAKYDNVNTNGLAVPTRGLFLPF